MTQFTSEKRRFISIPIRDALDIDLAKTGGAVVDPKSDEPSVRFDIRNRDFLSSNDLRGLHEIAKGSKTFFETQKKLDKLITKKIEPLPPDSGGGRTFGSRELNGFFISIWPEVILAGISILDVYLHEYGHVQEDYYHRRNYQQFLNIVQKELGVRTTPDSHISASERSSLNNNRSKSSKPLKIR